MATLAQGAGAFEPGRPRADDEDPIVGSFRRDVLRVPIPPPFFPDGGILRAAHGHEAPFAAHADVATNAFTDVLRPAFLDLPRQKRIGDGRARRTDEIQHAAFDL